MGALQAARIRKHPWITLPALIAITAYPALLPAHHGASEFDPNKPVAIAGTVTRFAFTNPHVQIFLEVIGARGERESWQGELPAPATLLRDGWNRRTLRPGDRVAITGFQAWKGERAIWVRAIAGPGGPLPLSQ
jgi:hypothetical protein